MSRSAAAVGEVTIAQATGPCGDGPLARRVEQPLGLQPCLQPLELQPEAAHPGRLQAST